MPTLPRLVNMPINNSPQVFIYYAYWSNLYGSWWEAGGEAILQHTLCFLIKTTIDKRLKTPPLSRKFGQAEWKRSGREGVKLIKIIRENHINNLAWINLNLFNVMHWVSWSCRFARELYICIPTAQVNALGLSSWLCWENRMGPSFHTCRSNWLTNPAYYDD